MIKPIYSKFDYAAERWVFGLSPEDFDRVQKGYACGNCLEDYNGIWRPSCPVCNKENEIVVDTPTEWRR
jgi:hypothetical protein